jgi:ATP/maltotriose-dependent transcriptional regulator MalT
VASSPWSCGTTRARCSYRTARFKSLGYGHTERTRARTQRKRPEEALAAAVSATEYREVVAENWGLCELVEPATRTGRTDLATDALNRLAAKASATGTAWALGIMARSRALLTEGEIADGMFREAIEHLSRTRVRAEQARTHLLYGEYLQRADRRVDARRELNVAFEMFSAMGMDGFADRARHELLATGERVRKRSVETRDQLTPQEAQIARLAGDGHPNLEISARLFLSQRTVRVASPQGIRQARGLVAQGPARGVVHRDCEGHRVWPVLAGRLSRPPTQCPPLARSIHD